jgi:hypothetical protein
MTERTHHHPLLWVVVSSLSVVAALVFLVMLAAGHSLAFSDCKGSYSLFAENARCRWVVVWAAGLIASLILLVWSLAMAVWHYVRIGRLKHMGSRTPNSNRTRPPSATGE